VIPRPSRGFPYFALRRHGAQGVEFELELVK
jgi:hypothetical protein